MFKRRKESNDAADEQSESNHPQHGGSGQF